MSVDVEPKTASQIVAGYTRISRVGARKGEGFISLEDQREGISRRAGELGLEIGEWFHDPDYSGGNLRRPEWERLMRRVLDPMDPLSGVVVVRVDRFARTVPEGAPEVKRIWDSNDHTGVFVAADLPVDTTTPFGKKTLWDWLSNAELFLEMTKEQWWRVKRRAINRGAHIGKTPMAYQRAPKGSERSGTLTPRPEWEPVIKALFEHAAKNPDHGEGKLETWANANNPRPDGRLWTTTTIGNTLKNRVYLGEISYKPRVRAGHPTQKFEPMLLKDAHPPIVTEELWNAAQRTRTRSFAGHQQNGERRMLQGVLRCSGCLHRMTPSMSGPGVRTYHCDGKTRSNGRCPHPTTLGAEHVERWFDTFMTEHEHKEVVEFGEVRRGGREIVEQAETARATAEHTFQVVAENLSLMVENPTGYRFALDKAQNQLDEAKRAYVMACEEFSVEQADEVTDERAFWETLTATEKNERLASVMDTVFVRPAKARGRHARVEDRILILWRGEVEARGLVLPSKGKPVASVTPVDWPDA